MARILIIEGAPLVIPLLAGLLTEEGHDVLLATNGKAGIHLAQTGQPDLIVMDLILPVIDGGTTARFLKSHQVTKHIRIIAISTTTWLDERSLEASADRVLRKPFDPDELLAEIALQLGYVHYVPRASSDNTTILNVHALLANGPIAPSL